MYEPISCELLPLPAYCTRDRYFPGGRLMQGPQTTWPRSSLPARESTSKLRLMLPFVILNSEARAKYVLREAEPESGCIPELPFFSKKAKDLGLYGSGFNSSRNEAYVCP